MMTYLFRMFCTVGILAWVTMFVTSCSTVHGARNVEHLASSKAEVPGSSLATATTAPVANGPNKRRISQREFGREAVFVDCRTSNCPAVTPKTWASASPESIQAVDSLSQGEDLQATSPGWISDISMTPDGHIQATQFPASTSGEVQSRMTMDAIPGDKQEASNKAPARPFPDTPSSKLLLVHFALGDDTLSDKAKRQIEQGIEDVSSINPIHLVAISGRTDNVGSQSLNQTLAWARARSVRDHLLSKYPQLASQLQVQAQGKCCFRASNQTEQGRAMNRRVELFIEALPVDP
jgi:outer membrane protein OmpA-like peptidoglycan-associated protein